jgi:hypothetical protein
VKVLWSLCGAINRLAMAIEANTALGYVQIQLLRQMDVEEQADWGEVTKQ